jgi:hypothetical protein
MGSGSGVINSSNSGIGVRAKKLSGVTLGVDHLFGSDFGIIIFSVLFFYCKYCKSSVFVFCDQFWEPCMVSDLVINRRTK